MTTFITRDELRSALHSVTVVDALPPAPYGQRHLPGALNLVEEDGDEHILGVLADKAAAVVTYSTDADCTRGPELAARLQALGYTDVRAVELHVHPYAETFLLLAGRGRWTCGEDVVELEPEGMVVVPPDTPHGFRNIGDVALLVVSVHERGTMRQTWLGEEPA